MVVSRICARQKGGLVMTKTRADILLVEQGFFERPCAGKEPSPPASSRLTGTVVRKPAEELGPGCTHRGGSEPPVVSRAAQARRALDHSSSPHGQNLPRRRRSTGGSRGPARARRGARLCRRCRTANCM